MVNEDTFDVGGDDNEFLQEGIKHYCRHLVGLAGYWEPLDANGEPNGQAETFSYSGTVISIKGSAYFLTAGHILDDLEKELKAGSIRLGACVLCDGFGPDVRSPEAIPFDYEVASKFHIYDEEEGLDFGLVELSPYYQNQLRANGIETHTQDDCVELESITFDQHLMIGFPEDSIERQVRPSDYSHYSVSVRSVPSIIFVEELEDPPNDLRKTTYQRFVGRVPKNAGDIPGMSGGPILGFSEDHPDKHWVVAIQSSWLPVSRITFGCPVPIIMKHLQDFIEMQKPELLESKKSPI